MTAVRPVGTPPGVDVCLVGALLYATPADYEGVLHLVRHDDLDAPALGALFVAVRRLTRSGRAHTPELVADEIRRVGQFKGLVVDALRAAVTSGACPSAVREYAAAVVAESLRRRIAAAGESMVDMAPMESEADLVAHVERANAAILDCAERLQKLRRDEL